MLDRKGFHAGASYDTSTGAMVINGAPVGCVPTYVGVGVSNLTLDVGLDNTDMCLLATIRGATIGCVRFVNTSDTVKQLICRDEAAGALAAGERPIDVALLKLSALDRKFVHAAGHFQGSAAGAAVAFGQRGGVVARTAAGIYTITLDRDIDSQDCAVIITVGVGAAAATDLHARVVHTTDNVKTVTIETLAAGADVDADFCWAVFSARNAPNPNALFAGGQDGAGAAPYGRGGLGLRNGAGDYQYTIDRQSAVGSHLALATPVGATGSAIRVAEGAVARKDVETQVQAAAAQTNCDHHFVLLRLN